MSYEAVLRQLLPLELDGVFDQDLAVEGQQLDAVDATIAGLRGDVFPDTANEMIAAWEALYLVTPGAGAALAARQAVMVGKLSQLGDIKKPALIKIAAGLGYTIYIRDYTAAMSDWLCAGDEVIVDEPLIPFTAGYGSAGDTLAFFDYWLNWIWEVVVVSSPPAPSVPNLEQLLSSLRPAHIQLNFTYL